MVNKIAERLLLIPNNCEFVRVPKLNEAVAQNRKILPYHKMVDRRLSDSKYLKFYARKNLLKFLVLPNGLSSDPRKSTKLTKPPIVCLRIEGVIVPIYIDIIVTGNTYEECLIGSIKTIKLFLTLGFIMHPEKSSLQPS